MKYSFYISLTFIMLLFGVKNSQAQNFKGRKSIGLHLFTTQYNANDNSTYTTHTNSQGIGVNAGYFLTNDWRVGVAFGFNGSVNDFTAQTNKLRGWNWRTFATNYRWFSKNMAFFIEPSFTYANTTIENEQSLTNTTGTRREGIIAYELDTRLGFLYTINQRFGIDLSFQLMRIGYNISDITGSTTTNGEIETINEKRSSTYFDLTRSIGGIQSLSLGFTYFF